MHRSLACSRPGCGDGKIVGKCRKIQVRENPLTVPSPIDMVNELQGPKNYSEDGEETHRQAPSSSPDSSPCSPLKLQPDSDPASAWPGAGSFLSLLEGCFFLLLTQSKKSVCEETPQPNFLDQLSCLRAAGLSSQGHLRHHHL